MSRAPGARQTRVPGGCVGGLALPCSCRHMHKYLLPQQADQLTWGLKPKVRNEWPLSLRLATWTEPRSRPRHPTGDLPGLRADPLALGAPGSVWTLQSGHEPQELVSARFQTDGSTYSNTYTAHTVKM